MSRSCTVCVNERPSTSHLMWQGGTLWYLAVVDTLCEVNAFDRSKRASSVAERYAL